MNILQTIMMLIKTTKNEKLSTLLEFKEIGFANDLNF